MIEEIKREFPNHQYVATDIMPDGLHKSYKRNPDIMHIQGMFSRWSGRSIAIIRTVLADTYLLNVCHPKYMLLAFGMNDFGYLYIDAVKALSQDYDGATFGMIVHG